jgi:hypothetical protein
MKTLMTSAMALVIASGAAFADGPICEREITLYQNGQLVDTSQLTFYPHGCDRFQYQPMTERQILNLGEHCSVESYASGGTEEEEVTTEEEVEISFLEPTLTPHQILQGAAQVFYDTYHSLNPRTLRQALYATVVAGHRAAEFKAAEMNRAQNPQMITETSIESVTRTVTVEREGNTDWSWFVQPGPRTDRCGFPGEEIAPLN